MCDAILSNSGKVNLITESNLVTAWVYVLEGLNSKKDLYFRGRIERMSGLEVSKPSYY